MRMFAGPRALTQLAVRGASNRWARLLGTIAAGMLAVGLVAGSWQFVLQLQAAITAVDGSEYANVDLVVHAGGEPHGSAQQIGTRIGPEVVSRVAKVPGVTQVAGDAALPAFLVGADGDTVPAPVGGSTYLRPWIVSPLSAYQLVDGRAPGNAGEVAVDARAAEAGGLGVGERTTLLLPGKAEPVTVVGVVRVGGDDASAGGSTVLAAPGQVQLLAGLGDDWQSIWVGAAPGTALPQLTAAVWTAAGTGLGVTPGAVIRDNQITAVRDRGFQIAANLAVLAAVGVFVGVFVIAGTFGTLVRQRSRELALLAAVGMTPRQLKILIRAEAVLVGLIAGAGGLVLGLGIAGLFGVTLARSGLEIGAAGVQLTPSYLGVALLTGVLVTWLASAGAARRAGRLSPVEVFVQAAQDRPVRVIRRLLAALPVFALAGLFTGLSFLARSEDPTPRGVTSAGTAAILTGLIVITGLAVLAPLFAGPVGWLVGSIAVLIRADVGRMVRSFIVRNPRRVGSAVALLMLTVALASTTWMVITAIGSGRAESGANVVTADLVVTTADQSGMPSSVAAAAAAAPGVEDSAALLGTQVVVLGPIPPPRVRGRDSVVPPQSMTGTGPSIAGLLDLGTSTAAVRALRDDEVALSAQAARTYAWPVGTTMVLKGVSGPLRLRVTTVYPDSARLVVGDALVTTATARAVDPYAFTSAVLIRQSPGTSSSTVVDDVARAVAGVPGAVVQGAPEYLHAVSTRLMFDPALLYVFLGVAILTASFGVATTLSLSVAERLREFGMLRAIGALDPQVRAVVRWEAATIVVTGAALGVGTAWGTLALAHAVTGSALLTPSLSPLALFAVAAGAAAVTFGASLLPARRAARVPTMQAVAAG
jgi:putative ABC transport system permease protein